jgi:hypothetical protein
MRHIPLKFWIVGFCGLAAYFFVINWIYVGAILLFLTVVRIYLELTPETNERRLDIPLTDGARKEIDRQMGIIKNRDETTGYKTSEDNT